MAFSRKESDKRYRDRARTLGKCCGCKSRLATRGTYCEQCLEYQKEYRERNRERVRENGRRYAQRIRRVVLEHYGGICACCGESQREFLGIDHIEGKGNQHRREISGKIYLHLRSRGYPEGFRVLCHNCNMALGFYGYCPHQTPNKQPESSQEELPLNA